MNTVLMQGYKIELTYCGAEMDFTTANRDKWNNKRQPPAGHYFWTAHITTHNGTKHLALQSQTIGPNDCPKRAMRKFMEAVGYALGECAKADAKELVPKSASA